MKQQYFRINYNNEKGKLIYCDPNEERNLINTIKLEILKQGTQYNIFKKNYEIEFLELTQDDEKLNKNMKLTSIKRCSFTDLIHY